MAAAEPNEQTVREALAAFRDPESRRNLVGMGPLGAISVQGDTLRVAVGPTSHSAVLKDEFQQQVSQRLEQKLGGKRVAVDVTPFERPPGRIGQIGLTAKSVIAV